MQFDLVRMRETLFFCAVSLCLIPSSEVVAAEWSIEPSISLNEEYNDNIRFATLPHPGVLQSRLSPSIIFSSKTEVSEVRGSARLNINRYTGDPLVSDRNDKIFSLLTRLQSERDAWAMNASYTQDSTTESEAVATGIVQPRTQRTARSLAPSWTRSLTERTSLKLDYSYQDVKYAEHINLNDYTSQQVGGTLQYRLTQQDQVSLSASYSKTDYAPETAVSNTSPFYFSTTTVNKSDRRNVQLGIDHEFSETLSGSVTLGIRNSLSIKEQNQALCLGFICAAPVSATSETRGDGSLFSANLDKKFESSKVSGFASRDTNASGSGLVQTDKFGVSLINNLTENLTGSLGATAYHTQYIGVIAPGSRYYTFEPKLNWHFTEWWTLDAGYRYARSEPGSANNATISNAVYLNLGYNWPKIAISR